MKTFKSWSDLPIKIEGHCYIVESNIDCWFALDSKNIRILHRIGGPAFFSRQFMAGTFWLYDKEYTEEEYWNHALIAHHKLKMVLFYDEDVPVLVNCTS